MKKDLKVHSDNIVMRRALLLKKGDIVLNFGEIEEAFGVFEGNEKTKIRLTFKEHRIFVSGNRFLFVEVNPTPQPAKKLSIDDSPLQPRERPTAINGIAID